MPKFPFHDYARVQRTGPNTFTKDTGPWQRTECICKIIGKKTLTVAEIVTAANRLLEFKGRDPRSTLKTLAGKRTIEIEGYEGRATEEEVRELRAGLALICAEMHPITVRGVFYQATVRGLVEKAESGYDKVQNLLAKMRRENEEGEIPFVGDFGTAALLAGVGPLPWDWIVDNTRSRLKPYTNVSPREALEETAENYRKSLWKDANAYVEIWLEKDALAGVISNVTSKYDVSLMVARGYASITFLHDAAEEIESKNCPVYIYHLGDFDPSGVNAGEKIEQDLQDFAPGADITFTRLAVTEEQIEEWDLPTRPTKHTDSRAARFGSDVSVELDAIDPRELRRLVERAIQKHMPKKRYEELMRQQGREQEQIRELIDQITDELGDEDNGDE